MPTVLVRDPDLHAYLMGHEVLETVHQLRNWLARGPLSQQMDLSLWWLHHAEADPVSPGHRETVDQLYRTCPEALAQRLHEALGVYRLVGRTALVPLLPLVHRLLQAEMHLYTSLEPGKPYRDHLAHQTRVAALAHLWLGSGRAAGTSHSGISRVLPEPLSWEHLRRTWGRSVEFHLLRAYALENRLPCPDPGLDHDPWGPVVRCAALLAGLVHDVGYVQKALGEVGEHVAHTFEMLLFPPRAQVDEEVDELPLGRLYRRLVSETEHGQSHAPLACFLDRHYRNVHSVVGALWLASLLPRMEREMGGGRRRPGEQERDGWAELCLQLAAMMAFAHDLAMADGPRRKLLGLREADKEHDALNLDDFPMCTLFSLCDVLQEFGRPVRVVEGEAVRFAVPMGGLQLELVRKGVRTAKQGSGNEASRQRHDMDTHLWDLEALRPAEDTKMYVSFGTRDSAGELVGEEALRLRRLGSWKEYKVGDKVPEWLERSGLGEHVRLDGDPSAAERVQSRYESLSSFAGNGSVGGSTGKDAVGMLRALARLLLGLTRMGRNTPRRLRQAVEGLTRRQGEDSEELLRLAPLADLAGADPIEQLAARALVSRGGQD